MTREEIEKAKEYQFAKAAMERRWGNESPIEAFEEGAEYGYKYAVEKACEWLIKGGYFVNNTETIEDFKKAMEE